MDEKPHASPVRIGECILDRVRGTLIRDGAVVPVRAKTFALLEHMVGSRGRVVSKDELMSAIWPDVIVSEDSLTQCVRDLRKALGDEAQQWLCTVSRRGYLLAEDAAAPVATPSMSPRRSLPAIAVLPFATAGNADTDLVDGIVEEVTNGLTLFRTITVIARASAFAFPVPGRPPPPTIGEKLGVDYIVEGSFRPMPNGFRISVTLMHAATVRQIWGERFDCTEQELLEVDALIVHQIVSRLAANIEASPLHRGAGTSSLAAFELLARGRAFLRGYGHENNRAARDNFEHAIEVDPYFGLAHAYLGLAEIILADYSAAPRHILERARDRAAQAITLSPLDARCYRIMGLARLYLREHEAAEGNLRRALALNPYDADTMIELAFVLAMRGRSEEALDWAERAVGLNPFHPPWYYADLAFVYYAFGDYKKAIEALTQTPEVSIYQELRLAASYAMAGDLPKAVDHVLRVRSRAPDLDLLRYMEKDGEFEHETGVRHLLQGIRLALNATDECASSP